MSILKFLLTGLLLVSGLANGNTQVVTPSNNPITSHVLDQHTGLPAENMKVVLYRNRYPGSTDLNWYKLSEKQTDENGRVSELVPLTVSSYFLKTWYKLEFDTLSYYKAKGEKTFFPKIEVVFEVDDLGEHYHVPLLLNAYGFGTYRGS